MSKEKSSGVSSRVRMDGPPRLWFRILEVAGNKLKYRCEKWGFGAILVSPTNANFQIKILLFHQIETWP